MSRRGRTADEEGQCEKDRRLRIAGPSSTYRLSLIAPTTMFQRILVANRGQIALRDNRACKDLGVEAVAVYSTADRGAPYLDLADRKVCIGPAAAGESYLKVPRLISAAEVTEADAIHPGYGFLSEKADFAEKCRDSNIEFI